MVSSIHKEDFSLLPRASKTLIPGPWREIKRMATEQAPVQQAFFNNLSIRVGDGSRTRFWHDPWLQNVPLKERYSALFHVSSQREALVVDVGWFEGDTWRWALAWQRVLTEEEQHQVGQLQSMLTQSPMVRGGKDQLCWCDSAEYSVRAVLKKAWAVGDHGTPVDSLACTVWRKLAPPKVELMVWLALLGRLNTNDLLYHKGMLTVEANRCTFCGNPGESLDHLLVSCQLSWQLWCTFSCELRNPIVIPGTLRQMYDIWMHQRMIRPRKRYWMLTFFAIVWSLWMLRNGILFKQQAFNMETLVCTIKWRVALWSKAWRDNAPYTAHELARNFPSLPDL